MKLKTLLVGAMVAVTLLTVNDPVVEMMRQVAAAWRPPPRLKVSEWAEQNRRLSRENSAEPGKWRNDRLPYGAEIMDTFNDPDIHTTVLMTGTQIGKSEILNNVMGYCIDLDPCPMIMVQPTQQNAEDYSKERIAPMIRDTRCLAEKIADPRSRDSNNTLTSKNFDGGHLALAGANSESDLRSRPRRVAFGDEIDVWPVSAGAGGDPLDLLLERLSNFFNRFAMLASSPGIKGLSRIEKAWKESDQRKFFVKCLHCEQEITLEWMGVQWPKGKPEEAYYACQECGGILTEDDRHDLVLNGQWKPTAPYTGIAGFQLSKLYSLLSDNSLAKIARAHVVAVRRGPESLKVWVNTNLGETWEDPGTKVDHEILYNRREEWNGRIPAGALCLVGGVDIQADRIEMHVVGYGLEEEAWSVDYLFLMGDTTKPEVWDKLDRALQKEYEHESGALLGIAAAGVDASYRTDMVHKFCLPQWSRNVFALRGEAGGGKPLFVRPAKPKKGRCPLFRCGVDTGKDKIYARLQLQEPGPGYYHFPMERTEEFFRQLTVEKQVTEYVMGHGRPKWLKPAGARNEALDTTNYALIAFSIYDPNLEEIAALLESSKPPQTEPEGRPIRGRFARR